MSVGYQVFDTPSKTLTPIYSNGAYYASFKCNAIFVPNNMKTCASGSFRQMVRGVFTANKAPMAHYLCQATGVLLLAKIWQEDGCPPFHGCTAYGYRMCGNTATSSYTPTAATGCNYYMEDAPGIRSCAPGTTYSIDLEFIGQLTYHVSPEDNGILVTRKWFVKGTYKVPTTEQTLATQDLQPDDTIKAVHNIEDGDGAPAIRVVLVRREGAPPLDPAAVGLILKDAQGNPVEPAAAPQAHQIMGRGHDTGNIIYPLPKGSQPPVKAVLTARGVTQEMDVQDFRRPEDEQP